MKLTKPVFQKKLQERIDQKIAEIEAVSESLPGVIIIHEIKDLSVRYMSPKGLRELGVSLEELRAMGAAYHTRFFNPEESRDYIPKIAELMAKNTNQTISFFQQVRYAAKDWTWHLSSTKIFMRDEEGIPILTITNAISIHPLYHVSNKVSRLLEENNFLTTHYQKFSRLSKRESEILKLMALGKSSPEISRELFISAATVDTHRKNIKKKLNTNSFYELSQYARAFDLI